MKSTRKQRSIIKTISLIIAIAAFVMIALTITLITLHSYNLYKNERQEIYSRYVMKQKNMIRDQVNRITFYVDKLIDYYYSIPEMQREPLDSFQNRILEQLAEERFNEGGYFFGSAKAGEPLFSNGIITKGTQNIWELTDPNGIKIIQEQLKALDHPEGIFLEYSWRKLHAQRPQPKISYSRAVKGWDWVLGAGIYLDDIVSVTAVEEMLLRKNLVHHLEVLLGIFFAYLLAAYLLIQAISSSFKANFRTLISFFENAVNNQESINIDKLKYKEIIEIASAANLMLMRLNLTEAALRQSERKYKLLAEIQRDLIITNDLEGILIYCSPTITEFAGYDPEEVIGKSVRTFLGDPSEVHLLNQVRDQVLQTKESQVYEILFKSKSGECFPVEVSVTPIIEEDEVIEFNSIIRNITKRKEVEEELQKYRHKLEEIVEMRTAELKQKNQELNSLVIELERMNKVFTGREFRIKELRDKIKKLEEN